MAPQAQQDSQAQSPPSLDVYTFSASNSKIQKAVLESEHPLYRAKKKQWEDFSSWFSGDGIEKYLYRHVREKEEAFLRRKERAYYLNYVDPIVDLICSFIFSRSIRRSPSKEAAIVPGTQPLRPLTEEEKASAQELGVSVPSNGQPVVSVVEGRAFPEEVPADLDAFWKNIDLKGTSINEFMRNVAIKTQVFGFNDVVVDLPRLQAGILKTEEERLALGHRPYAVSLTPLDVLNWETSLDGSFSWIRWREAISGDRGPFEKEKQGQDYRYYTWTRQQWFVHEIRTSNNKQFTVTEAGKGANPLGEVPVVRFFNKSNLFIPILGESAIKFMGKVNVQIFNLCSLADEDVYSKCLNLLVMQDNMEQRKDVEIGANNVLTWSGDAPPHYLTPGAEPGKYILELVQRCIEEIYRMATLGGDLGVKGTTSGVAYSYQFNQTNRMLADKADQMERGEVKVHRLWAKWLNQNWDGVIDYPDEFDVLSFEAEVDRLIKSKGAVRSPTFKRELEKSFVVRTMGKVSPDLLNKMIQEVELMDEPPPPQPFGAPLEAS